MSRSSGDVLDPAAVRRLLRDLDLPADRARRLREEAARRAALSDAPLAEVIDLDSVRRHRAARQAAASGTA